MKKRYSKALRFRRKAAKLVVITSSLVLCTTAITLGATLTTDDAQALEVVPEVIVIDMNEKPANKLLDGVEYNGINVTAGVATVFDSVSDGDIAKVVEEKVKEATETKVGAQIIRCTGYCDYGYTKSGEYVRKGIVAGKEEWLGKKCNLYRVNKDNTIGEFIGSYEFLDTGYGIDTKTNKGIEGSIRLGKSIDIWHPTEDAVWDWAAEYGDYVYMEITN